MRKTALFAAAVGVLVLIGVDAWLSIRTMTQGGAGWLDAQPVYHQHGCEGFAL